MNADLLVVPGLPRCATTSFVNVLSQHSDVLQGIQKEPHYFLPAGIKNEGYSFEKNRCFRPIDRLGLCIDKDSYRRNYRHRKGRYIIDASTLYSVHEGSIASIREEMYSSVKFIVFFRSAFERSLSHYLFSMSREEEYRTFELALKEEMEGRHNHWLLKGYLRGSRVKPVVDEIIDNFGRSTLLLVNLDTISIFDQLFMNSVCEFLEISPEEFSFDVYQNTSSVTPNPVFRHFRATARRIRQVNPELVDNRLTRGLFNTVMKLATDRSEPEENYLDMKDRYKHIFAHIDRENARVEGALNEVMM